MWDLPGPGLEPVSPALAGGFLTTAPPRKSLDICFKRWFSYDPDFWNSTNSTVVILYKHFPGFIIFHLLLVVLDFNMIMEVKTYTRDYPL